MFIKSHTELPVRFPTVGFELLRCPPATIVEVAVDVQRRGQLLLAEAGLGAIVDGFNKLPEIEVGDRKATDRVATLPFRLWADDGEVPLWSLDCCLDAAWLGPSRTYVALSGQYELPFAALDSAMDRALVHRIAETSAQQFVLIAARRLTNGTS